LETLRRGIFGKYHVGEIEVTRCLPAHSQCNEEVGLRLSRCTVFSIVIIDPEKAWRDSISQWTPPLPINIRAFLQLSMMDADTWEEALRLTEVILLYTPRYQFPNFRS
jgi:hypothetical protein